MGPQPGRVSRDGATRFSDGVGPYDPGTPCGGPSAGPRPHSRGACAPYGPHRKRRVPLHRQHPALVVYGACRHVGSPDAVAPAGRPADAPAGRVDALAFLEFIGSHLPAPSHEQTLCRFEQATLRAGQGADVFIAPDLGKWNTPGRLLRRGRSAGLVRFHAEPNALFRAILQQEPLPPLTPNAMVLLFGPGLERLCRPASEDEVRLWERLVTSVSVRALREEGYSLETLAALLNAGALEYADYPPL